MIRPVFHSLSKKVLAGKPLLFVNKPVKRKILDPVTGETYPYTGPFQRTFRKSGKKTEKSCRQ